ncbi:MAG: DNA-3-methyladenine glycosylase family protein [Kiloniellales bacterium]
MTRKPRPDLALKPALDALAARDADIAAAYADCGLPPVRASRKGFPGLLSIIVAQQVSAASARAITARLQAALADFTPEEFLALGEAGLREIGFSRQKIRYGRALAEDLLSGRISLRKLARLPDEEAIDYLSQAKGIGRWSAEVYLLFALKRPDIWPIDDLAVRVAFLRLKRLRREPRREKLVALAEPWRPYRSAAARFLWHYYRHPGLPDPA